MRIRGPLLALLALAGACDAFGDVERPEENGAAAGAGGSGPSGSGAGPSTSGAQTSPSAASGATCGFPAGDAACQACVESVCAATLGPACAVEENATVKLAACFFMPGCACENGYTSCFREYEEAVAGSSSDAFALEGCVKANCRSFCDCCLL